MFANLSQLFLQTMSYLDLAVFCTIEILDLFRSSLKQKKFEFNCQGSVRHSNQRYHMRFISVD